MTFTQQLELIGTILLTLAEAAVLVRAILRPHRDPASRLAWAVVIIIAPLVGLIAYLLVGEARLSNARRSRGREIEARLPRPDCDDAISRTISEGPYAAPFALASSVEGLGPTCGNRAVLALDSNAAIDAMEKMQDVDIGGFFVGYSPTNHAGSKFVELTIIARDGKFMR